MTDDCFAPQMSSLCLQELWQLVKGMQLPGEHQFDFSMFCYSSIWCVQQQGVTFGGQPKALAVVCNVFFGGVYVTSPINKVKRGIPYLLLFFLFICLWCVVGAVFSHYRMILFKLFYICIQINVKKLLKFLFFSFQKPFSVNHGFSNPTSLFCSSSHHT